MFGAGCGDPCIRDRVKQLISEGRTAQPNLRPENAGSQRLLQAAERAPVLDKRRGTATDAAGNRNLAAGGTRPVRGFGFARRGPFGDDPTDDPYSIFMEKSL